MKEKRHLVACVMCYVHAAGHDSPEIVRSDATDSQLQSSDSQDDSENDTPLDCFKIVVFLSYCSRRSRQKTLQYNWREFV